MHGDTERTIHSGHINIITIRRRNTQLTFALPIDMMTMRTYVHFIAGNVSVTTAFAHEVLVWRRSGGVDGGGVGFGLLNALRQCFNVSGEIGIQRVDFAEFGFDGADMELTGDFVAHPPFVFCEKLLIGQLAEDKVRAQLLQVMGSYQMSDLVAGLITLPRGRVVIADVRRLFFRVFVAP